MALIFSLAQSDVGAPFAEAYSRIVRFDGDKTVVHYVVTVYANKAAREGEFAAVAQYAFPCPLPTGDIMPALYADLKTRPGFEDAKDC